jgi:hypothetical protein
MSPACMGDSIKRDVSARQLLPIAKEWPKESSRTEQSQLLQFEALDMTLGAGLGTQNLVAAVATRHASAVKDKSCRSSDVVGPGDLGRQGTKRAQIDEVRAKGCRSRESNTGLVHGKHEFYH